MEAKILKNQRLSDEAFANLRKEVLAMWPTGADVDLDEAVEYQRRMPSGKNAALKTQKAKQTGSTYFCPSLGTDTIERHTALLQHMQNEAGAELVTTYIDSFTRTCRFDDAAAALLKARNSSRAVLNGFPVVEHGVDGNRKMIEALDVPVVMFGPTPDARLTHEIGLAGGHTGYSGGPLISFWNYTKDVPVAEVIGNFQYINRLMGHYTERGVPILYCVSGAMPAVSPPSLMIAPEIIEVLIAAEQGVKHVQLNCWLQGHLAQDIAYIQTFETLTREYLDRFGYRDVQTTSYTVCPTGRFPTNHAQVYGLISYFTMIGALGGAQVIGSRTIDEAHHIPTKEGSAESFKCARMMVDMLGPQRQELTSSAPVLEEAHQMEQEVRAILERVLEMGDGDLVLGTINAIGEGFLDQPYSTSQLVKGQVMGVKDAEGAARFFDFGSLPFNDSIKRFHCEEIARREAKNKMPTGYETIVKDMTAISMGSILPR